MAGTTYRCPRCGETKPVTAEHFYFRSSGRVQGWCRVCFRAWWPIYWAAASPYQRNKHRVRDRESKRRRLGITSDRYRLSRYDQEVAS